MQGEQLSQVEFSIQGDGQLHGVCEVLQTFKSAFQRQLCQLLVVDFERRTTGPRPFDRLSGDIKKIVPWDQVLGLIQGQELWMCGNALEQSCGGFHAPRPERA